MIDNEDFEDGVSTIESISSHDDTTHTVPGMVTALELEFEAKDLESLIHMELRKYEGQYPGLLSFYKEAVHGEDKELGEKIIEFRETRKRNKNKDTIGAIPLASLGSLMNIPSSNLKKFITIIHSVTRRFLKENEEDTQTGYIQA